jgi:ABC-type transporter Mla maintaining outer membrane lipid asymmetry ATPase subunit MlaF
MLRGGKIIFEGTDESLHKTEDAYIQRFIRGH